MYSISFSLTCLKFELVISVFSTYVSVYALNLDILWASFCTFVLRQCICKMLLNSSLIYFWIHLLIKMWYACAYGLSKECHSICPRQEWRCVFRRCVYYNIYICVIDENYWNIWCMILMNFSYDDDKIEKWIRVWQS